VNFSWLHLSKNYNNFNAPRFNSTIKVGKDESRRNFTLFER
jgi:hypothetical protein